MNEKLKNAFQHVRNFYPDVNMVVFNKFGQWNYMDDNFIVPTFSDEIDISILEEAADTVDNFPTVIVFN